MRFHNIFVSARRRRTATIAAGLAFGILATAGLAATPASPAAASGALADFALVSFTTPVERTTADAAGTTDETAAAARDALTAADDALAAAQVLSADIEAAGLDLGQPDTSIETTELEVSVARLGGSRILVTPFLPQLTADLNVDVASVDGRVSALRALLDDAKARKAAAEAEKARLEAEAAAAKAAAEAAAAKATASVPSSSRAVPAATGGGDNSPAGAQASARRMAADTYGWGDDQFSCLVSLWQKESGWNYQAHNASSGAHGIPQALPGSKMATAGADWQTNAATQVAWGLGYIAGRYGSPCAAWSHSQSVGWY